ncbi:MAG TPA: aspartate aminotransferase family protein [Verrucomicrobiae bacterium]|nr:aspartate aminotransferase family protein [Verrucomicrobiae bacterium]
MNDQLPSLKTPIPGPKSRALARQLRRYESRNITCISDHWPVFWQRASGANVWDVDGNRYIDLTAAFGVASVGHNNPRVVAALKSQAGKLMHAMGDVHPNQLKLKLARELVELTFGRWCSRASAKRGESAGRVVFANSGAEAVEVALKTAVMRTRRPGVIAFEGAYHGLTYGALDTTWRAHFRSPFTEQLGHFTAHVPFGRLPAVTEIEQFGAVIVEPIQGRGGIVVPLDDFLAKLRRFCDEHDLVLIFDEVYTGFCRTGKWFACEHWDVVPDVVCVGKAMAGGFPISACIGRANVMDSWPETHGEAIHTSTFLGNPLGCAAALAAIGVMKRLKLDARSRELGDWLTERLAKIAKVRGKGLMLGLEVGNAVPIVEKLLQRGVLALPEGDHSEILGITPPLVITERQLDYCLNELACLI